MAVGVSHLVQSTRLGADFGFSIIGFIILANVLKYPLFRFASTYAAITGNTLLEGYRKIGRSAVILLIISIVLDMFIAAAAVSLVSAGVVKSVFGLETPNLIVVACLGGIVFLIVAGSAYRLFERATVSMVFILALLTMFAAILVSPTAFDAGSRLFPDLPYSPELVLVLIAMAGWMPNPPSASFFLSAWTAVRHHSAKQGLGDYHNKEAIFDINLGYTLSLLIAVCFAIMGSVLIFLPGTNIDLTSAPAFADAFIELFTQTFGDWVRPIIGAAAILAMLSTMVALFDGAPRMMRRALRVNESNRVIFCLMFAGQLSGVLIIIWLFASSFRSFIDFITSVSFATAPFIAYFNHKLMFSEDIPKAMQPSRTLCCWSWLSIVCMGIFGLYFFTLSMLG
jgi:Mn2+/Fe2+ NRAMP family transporter